MLTLLMALSDRYYPQIIPISLVLHDSGVAEAKVFKFCTYLVHIKYYPWDDKLTTWSESHDPFYAMGPLSVLPVCLSVCLSCNVGVLWPSGWMDQGATWYGGRPRPSPHCVRWGLCTLPPPQKGHSSPPLFSECLSLLCSSRGFCAIVNYRHSQIWFAVYGHWQGSLQP